MKPALLPTLTHKQGETHFSFAARLSALHQSPPRDFYSDMGMRWPFLCSGHRDQLEQLAWISGCNLEHLSFWCPEKKPSGCYRLGKTVASKAVFRRAIIRICPKCIVDGFEKDGPHGLFQLLEWAVLSLACCEKHGAPLLTLPLARTSHETYDVVAQVLRYFPNIRKASETDGTLKPTLYEMHIRERIYFGAPADWLKKLNLAHLQHASFSLGSVVMKAPQRHLASLSLQTRREASEVGFKILSAGPDELSRQLDKLRERSRSSRSLPSTDLGVFYSWLQSVQNDPETTPITSCVGEHIAAIYPITQNRVVLGKQSSAVSHVTFSEVSQRLGLSVGFLKKLLARMNDCPMEQVEQLSAIKLSEIGRLQEYWTEFCNLKEAAELLAIRVDQVKGLVLLHVFQSERFGSALRYLRRSEVLALLGELDDLPAESTKGGYLSLRRYCQTRKYSLVRVLSEWRRGRLEGLVARGRGKGIHRLLIREDVEPCKLKLGLAEDLTVKDAALYLKISAVSVRKLRDAGFLSQVQKRNPDTNHRCSYISQQSLVLFERRYTTLGRVSEHVGIAPMHLARRLDFEGVAPPQGLDSSVRVYERAQLLNSEIIKS